jgi:hypothetical protein
MTVHRQFRAEQVLAVDNVAAHIREVRGQRCLLDEDLARLYGVPTRAINQVVARNPDRFPPDFALCLRSRSL